MGTTERLAHRDIVPGLVSVVLPVKNGERFIGSALDSVQRQTYGNHEILVVDGNSSDRTDEIVKSFSGVLWIPQETGGVTEGFNTGVRASRGEFVAFISHDDLWEPTKLERQVEVFQQCPEVALSATRFYEQVPGQQRREPGDDRGELSRPGPQTGPRSRGP